MDPRKYLQLYILCSTHSKPLEQPCGSQPEGQATDITVCYDFPPKDGHLWYVLSTSGLRTWRETHSGNSEKESALPTPKSLLVYSDEQHSYLPTSLPQKPRGLSLSCYYLLISPAPPPKICLPSQTSLACLDQLYQPTLKSPSLPKAPKAVLLLFKTDTNYGSLLINFR